MAQYLSNQFVYGSIRSNSIFVRLRVMKFDFCLSRDVGIRFFYDLMPFEFDFLWLNTFEINFFVWIGVFYFDFSLVQWVCIRYF